MFLLKVLKKRVYNDLEVLKTLYEPLEKDENENSIDLNDKKKFKNF